MSIAQIVAPCVRNLLRMGIIAYYTNYILKRTFFGVVFTFVLVGRVIFMNLPSPELHRLTTVAGEDDTAIASRELNSTRAAQASIHEISHTFLWPYLESWLIPSVATNP